MTGSRNPDITDLIHSLQELASCDAVPAVPPTPGAQPPAISAMPGQARASGNESGRFARVAGTLARVAGTETGARPGTNPGQ